MTQRHVRTHLPGQAGFSFLEVLIALSVLLVGSVAILSLFAVGAREAVDRKIEARLAQVRPEVQVIVQDALDAVDSGKRPASIRELDLSKRDYTLNVDFQPSPFGGPRWVAHAVILFRGAPVRVLPPIPLLRSTLDPR
jgi:prepilin-type N-terminal cleavage/methylation domain-containing protein